MATKASGPLTSRSQGQSLRVTLGEVPPVVNSGVRSAVRTIPV